MFCLLIGPLVLVEAIQRKLALSRPKTMKGVRYDCTVHVREINKRTWAQSPEIPLLHIVEVDGYCFQYGALMLSFVIS